MARFELSPAVERAALAAQGRLVPSILLDPPPTSNLLFNAFVVNGVIRRAPTKGYTAWRQANAARALRLASPTAYPVRLRYTYFGKFNRGRDLGNMEKAVTDLLVEQGVLADDNLRHVTGIELVYEPSEADAGVKVEIVEPPTLFGG
jgi:Holliday junction resolvase RusA-like endonuclease